MHEIDFQVTLIDMVSLGNKLNTTIGLVLVTHGRLAEEFLSVAEHIIGPQRQIKSVCIFPDDNMEVRRIDIINATNEVNDGSGVIILTDMFGGTPSNLAISVMDMTGVEVIAGVNLPILIKLIDIRSKYPIKKAVQLAQEAGRKYISIASSLLSDECA